MHGSLVQILVCFKLSYTTVLTWTICVSGAFGSLWYLGGNHWKTDDPTIRNVEAGRADKLHDLVHSI